MRKWKLEGEEKPGNWKKCVLERERGSGGDRKEAVKKSKNEKIFKEKKGEGENNKVD